MTTHTRLPVFTFMTAVVSSLMLTGCIIHVGASDSKGGYSYDDGSSYTSTNKSVQVSKGRTVDDVSSVNGSVTIENDVTADEISTVNGRIRIGDGVSASSVEGVNGKIEIGDNFKASESVETVNGSISIEQNSEIEEGVETVNGNITLEGVRVGENLKTKNGSIYLLDNTKVMGDVIFEKKPNQNKSWNQGKPLLKVDKSSNIEGRIIVYTDIEFDFADASLMEKVERR